MITKKAFRKSDYIAAKPFLEKLIGTLTLGSFFVRLALQDIVKRDGLSYNVSLQAA